MKSLQPKSEKCIFVGYYEDVKGYKLLQPHSNEIIIRKDVKFDENISACEPNSTSVISSVPILVSSSSDDDNKDENPPSFVHLPLNESIEHKPAPIPHNLRWVHSTR
jgi:hypothetical protein